MRILILVLACLWGGARARLTGAEGPSLLRVERIWDRAPHNAFTDLARFHDRWWCVFREGSAHVSPDGAIRVLTSEDGWQWQSAARLTHPKADLRDPKLSVTPDGTLLLTAAGAWRPPATHHHQTFAWRSANGREWETPEPIGEPDFWLWRVSWRKRDALAVGYRTAGERFLRLYLARGGGGFKPLIPRWLDRGFVNETTLRPLRDGRLLALVRRDGNAPETASALLGVAETPTGPWQWRDLHTRLGGPNWIELPEGRILVGGRQYDGNTRMSLLWLDLERARLTECLRLPSGGDTSYPGLVWHAGRLHVSWYSSHEGRTAIYVGEVAVPPAAAKARTARRD